MDILKSIVAFFFPVKAPAPLALPAPAEPAKLLLTEESQKLLEKLENQQLKEISDRLMLLAVNINALVVAAKNEQEFLVHIATLHEELLYQLDQGKVVMIKRSGSPTNPLSHDDEDMAAMDANIDKKNMN